MKLKVFHALGAFITTDRVSKFDILQTSSRFYALMTKALFFTFCLPQYMDKGFVIIFL